CHRSLLLRASVRRAAAATSTLSTAASGRASVGHQRLFRGVVSLSVRRQPLLSPFRRRRLSLRSAAASSLSVPAASSLLSLFGGGFS
ncbi:hypothetical protein LINPERHAP1_LOCUS24914, partial [Linum perenne]